MSNYFNFSPVVVVNFNCSWNCQHYEVSVTINDKQKNQNVYISSFTDVQFSHSNFNLNVRWIAQLRVWFNSLLEYELESSYLKLTHSSCIYLYN